MNAMRTKESQGMSGQATGRTKALLMAGGAAALLLLGACEKKAGGQVVAVVNGQEITQQELNGELGGATIPPGADKQKVMAQLLQRVIDRKLIVGKAKADGLDQSPTYLDQVRRAQDNILVSMLAQKIAKSQPLPDPAATDKFIASNPTMFAGRKRYTLDQIAFPASNDPALAAKLRDAHTLEAVEAALKSSGVQYQKGNATVDSAAIPPQAAAKIASLPAGEPFVVPQGGQFVANVIRSAEAEPAPAAQFKPVATELLRRQAVTQAMGKALTDERAKAKIDYQPGFAPPAAAKAPAKP